MGGLSGVVTPSRRLVTARPAAGWPALAATVACGLLMVVHPISFASFFADLRPSLMLALLMTGVLLWLGPSLLGELTRPAALPFAVFIAWEIASLAGHVWPGGYLAHWSSPLLVANAFSYLIIPQAACFLLGTAMGRDEAETDRFLRVLLWSNVLAVAVGLVLYLTRPAFVAAAEARIFREVAEKYWGFLPRMNGYFNSMVMGAVCYGSLGLLAASRVRRQAAFPLALLFLVGALLTLQRAAWVLAGGVALAWAAVGGGRALLRAGWRRRPLLALLLVVTCSAALVGIWQYARQQTWFGIVVTEFDNRVRFFDTVVDERRGQWDVGVALVRDHPFGVGVGIVSHKAAEVDGLFPYAVTDGNYFRILGEAGIPGLLLFLVVVARAAWHAVTVRRWDLAVPVLLLLAGAVGTNVFDLYYIGFVTWLLLGAATVARPHDAPPGGGR